ncbi:MAG: lamin tail domain-containing protein [Planktothrix agardhii KL2]|jgi:Lamin Tail Domain|uniref:lamin tail domain-containing protein n=1 Tax=Planktothrix agardhii TaxID=1160 RepID=UPI001A2B9F83|nr:lamin tail domain-containing protein [Planktothrix agardhii]MBG0749194.1 lamin tail domain-containing protein [Planktothrix agardhii KL2]
MNNSEISSLQSAEALTGGNELKKREISDSRTNFYIVDTNNPININGDLNAWEIWADTTASVQLIIYRKEAGSWSVVGKSDLKTPVVGLNQFTISTPITVKKGDYIGIYYPGAGSVSFNRKTAQDAWDLGNLTGTALFTASGANATAFSGSSNRIYSILVKGVVPVIQSPAPQPQPVPEVTPAPETTSEVTPAPQPVPEVTPAPETTPEPLVSDSEEFTITATKDVTISKLVYKGQVKRTQADEYIEISNPGNSPANLSGWKITSAGSLKQVFTFPQGTILEAGKSFRVYTNEVHPETGGFSFGSGTAIWNDAGDEAKLFDAAGNNVSTLAYGKNTIAGIKQQFQVPQLQFVATHSAINKQMSLTGKVTFTEALSLAIKSFLEDDTHPESPLAMILKKPGLFGLPADATKAMATEKLRSLMNADAKLILYPTSDRQTADFGETVPENWIFELQIGTKDRTVYEYFLESTMRWAIIPRSGAKVYNYAVSF